MHGNKQSAGWRKQSLKAQISSKSQATEANNASTTTIMSTRKSTDPSPLHLLKDKVVETPVLRISKYCKFPKSGKLWREDMPTRQTQLEGIGNGFWRCSLRRTRSNSYPRRTWRGPCSCSSSIYTRGEKKGGGGDQQGEGGKQKKNEAGGGKEQK